MICCQKCNKDKGSMLIAEWLDELRAVDDKRAERVARFIKSLEEK